MNKKLKKLTVALTAAVTAALSAGAFTAFADDTDIPIDESTFPDEAFRTYVQDYFGDSLSQDEIAEATTIDVRYKDITSLKGIEYFTALTYLDCYSNKLTELDISKNTALETLICGSNDLESLNVSSNDKLTKLHCNSNDLTSLNVSNNTKLTDFNCGDNELRSLDLSTNTDLEILECNGIGLTVLDLSSNTKLKNLDCFDNQLESLDLTYNTKLQSLNCSFNNTLKSLVLSQDAPLSDLSCQYNQLTSLDLSQHTSLTNLSCEENQLTSLDVKGCTSLIRLSCSNNQLTSLNVKGCSSLDTLNCSNNQLTSLDVSECDSDIDLSCNNQTYSIGDVDGIYLLSELPGSFDADKAANWSGATYDSTAKSLTDFTEALTVTYDYNCENSRTMAVTLKASSYTEPADGSILINSKNFPDDAFRQYISDNFDNENGTQDGKLSQNEIAKATAIDVSGKSIRDLTGIEYFTALTTLNCNNNTLLKSLDVSKNTALTKLTFSGCRISSLNVKGCEALTYIDCKENYELTSLDLSENTKLEYLNCYNNKIGSLDVSNNTNLKELDCRDNLLTSLNVKNCNALTKLICSGNSLTELDTSGCTALTILDCHESLELTSLNVSDSELLEELHCYNCKLTSLDVSEKTHLTKLFCDTNKLTELKLSGCTALKELDCYENNLESLDVTGCTALTSLKCNDNQLTSLDLTKNTSLSELNCFSNQLESLDLSHNTSLSNLNCRNNHLTSLDLNGLENLSSYTLYDQTYPIGEVIDSYPLSKLPEGFVSSKAGSWTGADYDADTDSLINFSSTSVTYKYNCGKQMMPVTLSLTSYRNPDDVEINEENFPDDKFRNIVSGTDYDKDGNKYLSKKELAAVTEMNISGQSIADLKGIEYFTALTKLDCSGNSLTSLDVSKNTALTKLDCTKNQLTTLDVRANTSLKELYCYSCKLTSIDASDNTLLTALYCNNNQLTELKISGCILLNELDCGKNNFTSLDLSDNTRLETLKCSDNQLTSLNVSGCTALKNLSCQNNNLTSLDLSKNTSLSFCSLDGQTYPIGEVIDSYPLSKLPTGFDSSKATIVSGAEYDADTNSLINFSSTSVKYSYECSDNRSMEVTLSLTSYRNPDDVEINEENFPDENFRNIVKDRYDKDKNGYLSKSELNAVTLINVMSQDISDLKGIEYFTALNTLYCSGNNLTSLDLSKNTALTKLQCNQSQLTSLNVKGCTNLTDLICYRNYLTSLDLSDCPTMNTCNISYQVYFIGNEGTDYPLTTLPGSFDPSKAKDWTGAAYNSELNSLESFTSTAVYYNYDCGNGKTMDVTLLRSSDYDIPINEKYFPDEKFRKYILNNYIDNNKDDILSKVEIASVTTINITSMGIADLSGIEYFPALERLYANHNQLTSLDLSKNTAVTDLKCIDNQLTSLKLSGCKALTKLDCKNNQLTSLDLSDCTALTDFTCDDQTYSIGKVNGSYEFSKLPAGFDPARASGWTGAEPNETNTALINFTANSVTYTYNCGNEKTMNVTLTLDSFINFGDVEINEENFPDAIFRQYVSDNFDKDGDNVITKDELASITEIDASNKGISDLKGIEYFTALESLNVGSNKLASLDVSKLTALTQLWCENNQLTALDLSGNTQLTYLSCGTNQLTALDVSGNTKLTALICYNNKLTALDVSKNTALESLKCDSNQLTELDVSKNAALKYLSCLNNSLTSLDVSSNIKLTHLICDDNRLASLDVSKNTALENLSCSDNQLTELDVSKNTALKRLYCDNNQLTRLDVSRNTELTILNCENNRLTSLDLRNNNVLKSTYLTGNSFDIGEVTNSYDLANLPAGFDSSMASNWQGATCENGVLTGFTANTITYTYDCGNGISETFTLTATLKPADPDQPDNPDDPETDPISDFAERLYTTLLGRPSDEQGKADWVADLKNGRPAADVASGFVLSEELANQNLSNSEFIDRMYRTLLNREADEAGKAEWVSALDNGCSYGYILNNFAGSQEFTNLCGSYGITAGTYVSTEPRDKNADLTAFVSRMYTKALDRAYDVYGLNDWTNDYLTGAATAEKIAYGFIFSPEFVNKELPDENYVDVLYRTFFDREADAEGRADWLNEMANGASREDVLNGFLGSQEFANLKAGFNV